MNSISLCRVTAASWLDHSKSSWLGTLPPPLSCNFKTLLNLLFVSILQFLRTKESQEAEILWISYSNHPHSVPSTPTPNYQTHTRRAYSSLKYWVSQKVPFGFFQKMLHKNFNELFGQANSSVFSWTAPIIWNLTKSPCLLSASCPWALALLPWGHMNTQVHAVSRKTNGFVDVDNRVSSFSSFSFKAKVICPWTLTVQK